MSYEGIGKAICLMLYLFVVLAFAMMGVVLASIISFVLYFFIGAGLWMLVLIASAALISAGIGSMFARNL